MNNDPTFWPTDQRDRRTGRLVKEIVIMTYHEYIIIYLDYNCVFLFWELWVFLELFWYWPDMFFYWAACLFINIQLANNNPRRREFKKKSKVRAQKPRVASQGSMKTERNQERKKKIFCSFFMRINTICIPSHLLTSKSVTLSVPPSRNNYCMGSASPPQLFSLINLDCKLQECTLIGQILSLSLDDAFTGFTREIWKLDP